VDSLYVGLDARQYAERDWNSPEPPAKRRDIRLRTLPSFPVLRLVTPARFRPEDRSLPIGRAGSVIIKCGLTPRSQILHVSPVEVL